MIGAIEPPGQLSTHWDPSQVFDDVWQVIFKDFSLQQLAVCRLVCRVWARNACDRRILARVVARDHPNWLEHPTWQSYSDRVGRLQELIRIVRRRRVPIRYLEQWEPDERMHRIKAGAGCVGGSCATATFTAGFWLASNNMQTVLQLGSIFGIVGCCGYGVIHLCHMGCFESGCEEPPDPSIAIREGELLTERLIAALHFFRKITDAQAEVLLYYEPLVSMGDAQAMHDRCIDFIEAAEQRAPCRQRMLREDTPLLQEDD